MLTAVWLCVCACAQGHDDPAALFGVAEGNTLLQMSPIHTDTAAHSNGVASSAVDTPVSGFDFVSAASSPHAPAVSSALAPQAVAAPPPAPALPISFGTSSLERAKAKAAAPAHGAALDHSAHAAMNPAVARRLAKKV